ncbi:MAG: hypothetical protein C5B50_10895 [Verrucomicrobia bacterium]|nr:MAG: hypothetical protein C5B50_10895 [Verrucomicrobiota bacterium]
MIGCLAMALCARTWATVIDTYPDWDGNVTLDYVQVAQSFLAPSDNILSSWQFTLAPAAGPTNVLFEIVPWNATSGPSGGPLFSRTVGWAATGGDVLVTNINLALTPGSRYAALVDLNGYAGQSLNFQFNQNSYNLGSGAWLGGSPPSWKYLNGTYNTEFRAVFSPVPEPTGVFFLGIAGAALFLWQISRRRS